MTALEVARSALFVPGDRPDRFDKAAATGALVVLDLEDAVAPGARPVARRHVRRWLDDGGHAVVRVQAASAPGHGEDVEARDIVVHLVEEYARHAGHADLLRECVDGRTGQ